MKKLRKYAQVLNKSKNLDIFKISLKKENITRGKNFIYLGQSGLTVVK